MWQAKKYIENIQEQVQSCTENKDVSTRELERQAGLKRGSIQNILDGKSSNPRIEIVMAIAEALNCTVDELLNKSASRSANNQAEEENSNKTIAWNSALYRDCIKEVENYLQVKNRNLSDEQILYLIKEAYTYSIQGESDKADLRFIKWFIDNYR